MASGVAMHIGSHEKSNGTHQNAGGAPPPRVMGQRYGRSTCGGELMAISAGDALTITSWLKLYAGASTGSTDTNCVATWIRSHWGDSGMIEFVRRSSPLLQGMTIDAPYPELPGM